MEHHTVTPLNFPHPSVLNLSKAIDPQQFNRYGYVRNNPLKHIDPDGRISSSLPASRRPIKTAA
jgi:hypothetical protein